MLQPLYLRQTPAMNKIAFARSPSSVGLGLAPAVYSAKANRCGGSEPPPYERSSVRPLYLRQTTADDKIAFARSPSSVGLGLAPAVYSAKANHCGGGLLQPFTLPRSTAAEGASPLRTKDPQSSRLLCRGQPLRRERAPSVRKTLCPPALLDNSLGRSQHDHHRDSTRKRRLRSTVSLPVRRQMDHRQYDNLLTSSP